MPKPAAVLLGVILTGIAGLLATSLLVRTPRAFTLGVNNGLIAAEVPPGQVVCQGTILVPPDGEFERVRFSPGTYHQPGPRLEVRILDAASSRVLGRGALTGGYPDIAEAPSHSVRVGTVKAGRRIRVCIANRGGTKVAVFGQPGTASASTAASIGDQDLPNDLNLMFERKPRSLASLAPAIIARAALFRAGWVGGWTYVVLASIVLLCVPLLLLCALRSADLTLGDARGAARRSR